jgi:hypothetical protein
MFPPLAALRSARPHLDYGLARHAGADVDGDPADLAADRPLKRTVVTVLPSMKPVPVIQVWSRNHLIKTVARTGNGASPQGPGRWLQVKTSADYGPLSISWDLTGGHHDQPVWLGPMSDYRLAIRGTLMMTYAVTSGGSTCRSMRLSFEGRRSILG